VEIARMAGPAIAADAAAASSEEKKLNTELKAAESAYKASAATYATDKAPYDAKLAIYSTDVAAYNAKADRTTAEKSSLDSRKTVLDGERDVLMVKWNALQGLKNDLLDKQTQANNLVDKINKALEQLKLCKDYGERALKVAKAKKWGSYTTTTDFFGGLKIVPNIDLLNGNMEEMKDWAGKVWN